MFSHRKTNEVPQLNTTSTADISFMLLVFFLVTSSMNTDKGLGRRLSPIDEQHQEQRDINRSNVIAIRIGGDNRLSVDGKECSLEEVQQQVESFVASRMSDSHVIAVEADRRASYQAYFELQDAIVRAYRSLRNQMALRQYGHDFAHCSQAERDVIVRRYPQRIAEGMTE